MSTRPGSVQLRAVEQSDLEVFFHFQQDPESNEMAKVHRRDRANFDEHWLRIMSNPEVHARTIVHDGAAVGMINIFKVDDDWNVGYWLERACWGMGIASGALFAILQDVDVRPIKAIVATTNLGSIRVLERCGFVKVREYDSPETKRYAACVEAVFVLE